MIAILQAIFSPDSVRRWLTSALPLALALLVAEAEAVPVELKSSLKTKTP
jgi:hypothetical protein